jgi:hypothetical protein
MNTEQMQEARAIATQCWCDEETKHLEMNTDLAEAFAKRIVKLQAALSIERPSSTCDKSVPDIVVVNNMNFDGDSHYGTREGDVFVMDDGDVYTYEQLKAEYECEWYYAAPQPPDDRYMEGFNAGKKFAELEADDRVRELDFDTIEHCFPDRWELDNEGYVKCTAQELHDFARAIDQAMKEANQ